MPNWKKLRTVSRGNEQREKPKGYWQDWANIEREARAIVAERGELPGSQELTELGHYSFVVSCFHYHGGMNRVRTRLGLPLKRRANGWTKENTDTLDKALMAVVDKIGHFPSCPELKRLGHGDLLSAIGRTGGVRKARERVGAEVRLRDQRSWTSQQQIVDVLRPHTARLGRMLTKNEYQELGLTGLYAAMVDRFDIQAIAAELGVEFNRLSPGSWKDWNVVEARLQHVVERTGTFPTHAVLVKIREGSLSRAIVRLHGGYAAVREKMGYAAVTDEDFARHADMLARILPRLATDPHQVWSTMKQRWTRRDLDAAMAEYNADGTLTRFRALVDQV